ncbi:MAG: glutamate-5-semialdehyde dehydrogenase [Patescibacteria group bacterium]|nr:glutamate-5-semialdehyde dehydrogenase [Patescibacteria group bacterium]
MNRQVDKQLKLTKQASLQMAKLSAKRKEDLLLSIAKNLGRYKREIFEANAIDVSRTEEKGTTSAFLDRLTISEKGFAGMIAQLKIVAHLQDATGEIIEQRRLANGVHLQKMRFPIGVIFMIYESRPNVTIDVTGLCLKSGNAVILKGGREAVDTNRVLVRCIHEILEKFDIAKEAVTFLDNINYETVDALLKRNDVIDVVIPRGSYGLTTAVAEKSRIPILYHASGGARMYIDKSANIKQALEICVNAKTNRTGVCNALDMALVHKDIAKTFLTNLDKELSKKGVEARADRSAKKYMQHAKIAKQEDFSTEFLDSILAVKVVSDAEDALLFIKTHTHGHTEILAAKDTKIIDDFIQQIDAAGLMINCSSRLHDGGEFEMGAEMGTATGKLHARGPVGIRELTTYKWIAFGAGQVKK